MISNPGQGRQDTSNLMNKSVYDTSNKNQDIFTYTDQQVSTRVTATQMNSAISSATANFVTSTQVDDKILESRRFQWSSVVVAPMVSNADDSHLWSTTSTQHISLPIPIDYTKYVYQYHWLCLGLHYYSTSAGTSGLSALGTVRLKEATDSSSSGRVDLVKPTYYCISPTIQYNVHISSLGSDYIDKQYYTISYWQDPDHTNGFTYVQSGYQQGSLQKEYVVGRRSSTDPTPTVYNYLYTAANSKLETFGIILYYRAYAIK